MHQALMRGTFLSVIGIIIILFGGAFTPQDYLKIWGLPIFVIGIAFITWGMLPYRKLRRLEINPDCIQVDSEESLHFTIKGEPIFSLSLADIEHIEYIQKNHVYGIGIILRKTPSMKMIVYHSNWDLAALRKKSIKEYSCDLFLPYFSKYSFQELTEVISI